MKKILTTVLASIIGAVILPVAAFAHVVVTPSQAAIGEWVEFSTSVPNERDSDVTSVRVAIPSDVAEVMPTAIAGWTITTDEAEGKTTAITWTGSLPSGQRQDFSFEAQTPSKATELNWKAYQTYADGKVVHWDQKPSGDDDASGDAGPYSVTKVTNDLDSDAATTTGDTNDDTISAVALVVSIVALVLGVASILTRKRR